MIPEVSSLHPYPWSNTPVTTTNSAHTSATKEDPAYDTSILLEAIQWANTYQATDKSKKIVKIVRWGDPISTTVSYIQEETCTDSSETSSDMQETVFNVPLRFLPSDIFGGKDYREYDPFPSINKKIEEDIANLKQLRGTDIRKLEQQIQELYSIKQQLHRHPMTLSYLVKKGFPLDSLLESRSLNAQDIEQLVEYADAVAVLLRKKLFPCKQLIKIPLEIRRHFLVDVYTVCQFREDDIQQFIQLLILYADKVKSFLQRGFPLVLLLQIPPCNRECVFEYLELFIKHTEREDVLSQQSDTTITNLRNPKNFLPKYQN